MSALCNEGAALLLNHMTGNGSYNSPAQLYLALHASGGSTPVDPGEPKATISITEVNWTSYARQAINFNASSGPDPAVATNIATITFPAVNSGNGPVTITGISIWDAAISGNCLYKAAMHSARTLQDTDALIFSTGEVTIGLD